MAALLGAGRLKNGSKEAKLRMAYLRARRGKTSKKAAAAKFLKAEHINMKAKKGTAAMKRKMAALRAMRGGAVPFV